MLLPGVTRTQTVLALFSDVFAGARILINCRLGASVTEDFPVNGAHDFVSGCESVDLDLKDAGTEQR